METPSSSSPSSSSGSSSPSDGVSGHSGHHPSSPPDKYNVRWTTHHAETWSAFSSLLASGRFVDVTLCCRNRTFKAHRVVLSACSPYLRELLDSDAVTGVNGPHGASHPILILQDATPEAVEHVIEFMYTGNVDIPSRNLADFIKLAECFQVRGIKADADQTRPNSSSSAHPSKLMKPPQSAVPPPADHHGLPSPPSSTHDEDGERSPKRRMSATSIPASDPYAHHPYPHSLPTRKPHFEPQPQMVNHYFRSLYYTQPQPPHAVPQPNGKGVHEEDEPMVTIEKVYLQNGKRREEEPEVDVDGDVDDDEPCDFSMSKPRENGESSEKHDEEDEEGERSVAAPSKKRRQEMVDEDEEEERRSWHGEQYQRGPVPVEVTIGEGEGDDEGGDDKMANGRMKNDRNPPALLPYQGDVPSGDRPFNIPADVSPESPLFKVSNSDTIWVGKTYNNWTMYFCSLCPYQSRIKSHLWRHSVKHTGQKPFVCALCLKAFSRRDNLKQHMNYKHPGYDLEPKRDTPAARQAAAMKTIIKGV